jgi:RimJ/RimL family protein N-acetyltransferase
MRLRDPMKDKTPHSDAIRLRPMEPGDLPALFAIQSDLESNAMAGTKPRSRDAFFAAWERHLVDPGINSRVIEVVSERGAEVVGSISSFQAQGRDCVGYWLARSHWGRGIVSRALTMFLAQEPRRPLHAAIASGNAASRRILTKCGFRLAGLRMDEETDRYVAGEIAEFVLE